MTKHKTEDYNFSAVKYYLNNDKGYGYNKTCKRFDCNKVQNYTSNNSEYLPRPDLTDFSQFGV